MWKTKSGFNSAQLFIKNQTTTFKSTSPDVLTSIGATRQKTIHQPRVHTEGSTSLSSLFKSKVNDRKGMNLFRQKEIVGRKVQMYNSTSRIAQLHEQIVKSLKHMPRQVINFLNINHYHEDFKLDARQIEQMGQEVEYELVGALEQIEEKIVGQLYSSENYTQGRDQIAKRFVEKGDPYQNFDLQMIPQMIGMLNEFVGGVIKLLSFDRPQMALSVENIWKLFVFLMDMSLQWSYDRNNKYIKERV